MRYGILVCIVASFLGCSRTSGWYREQRTLYDGIPTLVAFSPADPALAQQAWDEFAAIDTVFNDYRADSEISRLNALDDQREVVLSPMLAMALADAQRLHEISHGVFDISIRPVREVWKDAARSGVTPSDDVIAAARMRTGLGRAHFDGHRLHVSGAPLRFDTGGFIKGWAVDRVIARLRAAGAQSAQVQLGGETACFGPTVQDDASTVGIEDPRNPAAIWCALRHADGGLSVATSSNAHRAIVVNGVPVYHIFDPRLGRPVSSDVLSVTVAFPTTGNNALADALSTTGTILSPDEFIPLVTALGGEAMVLRRSGDAIEESQSPGWNRLVVRVIDGP